MIMHLQDKHTLLLKFSVLLTNSSNLSPRSRRLSAIKSKWISNLE